jgi:Tfp pilus assembly protein PilV
MGKQGFSLVELLVSLLLFMLVSLGVLPLLITNLHGNTEVRLRGEAQRVAAEIMDRLQATPYRTLGGGEESVVREGVVFTCQIETAASGGNDRRTVDLTVSWQYRGRNYSYTLSGIRVRNG